MEGEKTRGGMYFLESIPVEDVERAFFGLCVF